MKTKEEVERSLEKEKLEVNKMANGLYSMWTKIMEERTKNGFLSTNVELKVHSQSLANGEIDQLLDLKYDNSPTPEKDLNSTERSRQLKIRCLQAYAILHINDRRVSKTNKVLINSRDFNF